MGFLKSYQVGSGSDPGWHPAPYESLTLNNTLNFSDPLLPHLESRNNNCQLPELSWVISDMT